MTARRPGSRSVDRNRTAGSARAAPDRTAVTRLLAALVHRGMLAPDDARAALAAADPGAHLVATGRVDAATWSEWVRTEAGTRPTLSRYELGDVLGEGGQARVFRAIDRTDGSRVALKVLRPEIAKDPKAVQRFVAESRLLIDLDHPHIVHGQRVAREGATVFCAMEVVEGECLQQVIEREGSLAEADALRVVRDVAAALSHLHGRGLVHRDVKPGNVMRAADGRSVLIDLGFAVGGGEEGGETTAGTVHYIAPEQARGHAGLDVRADIYALGATLYHLVTGSLPFAGRTSEEVLAKQVLESLSGERIRALEISPQVHYLIEKMMAKEKEIRFQDPAQLAREVDAVLTQRRHEEAAGAEEDSTARRMLRRRRR
jgi:serine/threonine protein kinase